MSSDILLGRIQGGENESTAFVPDAGDLQAVGRAVCALLNTKGGTAFCGVSVTGDILGIGPGAEVVASDLGKRLIEAISPLALFMVSCVQLDGQAVIVIEIPVGKDGPYFWEGGVWLRTAAATHPANVEDLRRLLTIQAEVPVRWERRISSSMSDEELDVGEVRTTTDDAEKKGFKFLNRNDPRQVLSQLSVLESSGFTNAGDLLFSRSPGLRNPQCRAQLVVFKGDKSSDEFADNRWFDGPIARVCRELIAAVNVVNPLRTSFVEGRLGRRDRFAYDPDAIGEGIVNAFVHRDYAAYSGGLRVSVYTSRIEIWNTGQLPPGLTLGALRGDHDSIPTNPDIAQIFHQRRLMERIGRGTEFIVRRSRELGAPAPIWRSGPTGVTLTIYSTNRVARQDVPLNARQQALLQSTPADQTFSLREYSERFASDVSERHARRDLEELEQLGFIARSGRGRTTQYRTL